MLGGLQQRGVDCVVCGRGFGRLEDLRRHVRTHTGEKPYACPHCPYRSTRNGNLRDHIKRKHGPRMALGASGGGAGGPPPPPTSVRLAQTAAQTAALLRARENPI